MTTNDLFGQVLENSGMDFMTVIPTSVIDIGPQKKSERRGVGGHDRKSSRQEYSPFPEEVSRLCFEFYLRDSKRIFDPFCGWGERAFWAAQYGKKYTGYDINPEAIRYAKEFFGVANTLADSAEHDLPSFDGVITCPPYWNLEAYSADGLDSAPTWASFLYEYWGVWGRVFDAATAGTVFCVQVGDWRANGMYYDLTHKTRVLFEEMGAETVDDVVLSRKQISKIKVMLPQAKRLGYSVKTHEYLLVFRKPRR